MPAVALPPLVAKLTVAVVDVVPERVTTTLAVPASASTSNCAALNWTTAGPFASTFTMAWAVAGR